MNVLLVSVNREKMPAPVFPLGVAYIAKALRDAGHSVKTVDLCFSQDARRELEEVAQQFEPGVIGFSLRNLDNLTYPKSISYLNEVEEVVRTCRHITPAKLIVGGSGASTCTSPSTRTSVRKCTGSRTRIMPVSAPRRTARPGDPGRSVPSCRPRRPTRTPARRWCRSTRRTSRASPPPSRRAAR